MADKDYWDWYASTLGSQSQKAPEVLPQVSDWNEFYRSVGIPSGLGSPPSTRTVQSVPVQGKTAPTPASVEDRVTARNTAPPQSALQRLTESYGVPQGAETIARYQTPSVSDYVRGKSGQLIPDRLSASGGIPANFGGFTPEQVAQQGVGLTEQVDPMTGLRVTAPNDPLRILIDGANPIQTAQAKVAPVPFPPYRQVGSSLSVPAPTPQQVPMARAPQPMQRPQIQQVQQRIAPTPMPASMRPQQQGMGIFGSNLPSWTNTLSGRTNVIDAALKRTFNGNAPQQSQSSLVADALRNSIPKDGAGQSPKYQDLGNGKFQDNLGGVYFTRNL